MALNHRLFVSGWCLSGMLRDFRANATSHCGRLQIVLAFDGDKPVGVVTVEKYNGYGNYGTAFIRKSYRRRGIASSAIKFGDLEITKFDEGIPGSFDFWLKMRNTTGA